MEPINNDNKPFIVFFFSGQGAIYSSLAKVLYNEEIIFRNEMDRIDEKLKLKFYGYSMIEKLRTIDENDRIGLYDQHLSHSILFMLQISLFKLYQHYGIAADLIFGISLGEIAASYCSGILDLDTACYVLYSRANTIIKTITNDYDSSLLSVDLSVEEYTSKYGNDFPNLEIACYLHAQNITLGGKVKEFNMLIEIFKRDNVEYKLLPIAASFHTSSMDVIKKDVIENIEISNSKSPTIPHISSVTCKFFNEIVHPFNSNYLFDNIREPVLLNKTIEIIFNKVKIYNTDNPNNNNNYTPTITNTTTIITNNNNNQSTNLIEISPQLSLSYFIKKTISELSVLHNIENNNLFFAPLNRDTNDTIEIQNVIHQLLKK